MNEIQLSDIIFNPTEAYNTVQGGLDTLLLGLLLTPASKYDPKFDDLLRNHLFEAQKRNQSG